MTREEEGRNAGWTTERRLVPLSEGGAPRRAARRSTGGPEVQGAVRIKYES